MRAVVSRRGTQGLPNRALREHELETPLPGSYEHYLSSASFPRFVLDLRSRDLTAAGSSWLAGSRMFRFIGGLYDPENREQVLGAHARCGSGSM